MTPSELDRNLNWFKQQLELSSHCKFEVSREALEEVVRTIEFLRERVSQLESPESDRCKCGLLPEADPCGKLFLRAGPHIDMCINKMPDGSRCQHMRACHGR